MAFALHKSDTQIRIYDKDSRKESAFHPVTGDKLWGDLVIEADEVLYMAWRQTQSSLNDKQLRELWAKRK